MGGLSKGDCISFLPCIKLIVRTSSKHAGSIEPRLDVFPQGPRTVPNVPRLDPDANAFGCRPKWFVLYHSGGRVPEPFTFNRYLGVFQADILSGNGLRHILDNDRAPFLPSQLSEVRDLLGPPVDAFNPFLNKQAGRKASVHAIYTALLNLPPLTSYRVENAYLAGAIPGSHERSLTQIDHLLLPLVNELLALVDPGICYTRAPTWVSGKFMRAVLVPLTCDFVAARRGMDHDSRGDQNNPKVSPGFREAESVPLSNRTFQGGGNTPPHHQGFVFP